MHFQTLARIGASTGPEPARAERGLSVLKHAEKITTGETIEEWADEAERGYDVEQPRKRGRKPAGDGPARVVPVRIDDTLLSAIDERAARDHLSRWELIRTGLRAYVA